MKLIDKLAKLVGSDMDSVERCLAVSVDSDIEMLSKICSHILSSGGKRLRPLILLLTANFCGYRGRNHIPLACVLEYIHTATLLHDDVIDHAEIRRGNSAANMVWGNQATVLAGDYFFAKAFAMAVRVGDLKILDVIASTSESLAQAEVFQVSKEADPELTEEDYFYIIENKTACLMAAATRIGGILGGATDQEEKSLEAYGLNVGIAFQIMDDVLDYYSCEKEFGKAVGKDLQEGSVTLPFIAALRKSSPEDRNRMVQIIRDGERDAGALAQIIDLMEKYQGHTYAVDRAKAFSRLAVAALADFKNDEKKRPLVDLAEYVVSRKF